MFKLVRLVNAVSRRAPPLYRARPSIPKAETQAFRNSRTQLHCSAQSFALHREGHSHPLFEQLQSHPHIMRQLIELVISLQSKGFALGEKPSFMQVMKTMSDPEVRDKVKKLTEDMQTVGIHLDMTTITELQDSLKASLSGKGSVLDDKKDDTDVDSLMKMIKSNNKKETQ